MHNIELSILFISYVYFVWNTMNRIDILSRGTLYLTGCVLDSVCRTVQYTNAVAFVLKRYRIAYFFIYWSNLWCSLIACDGLNRWNNVCIYSRQSNTSPIELIIRFVQIGENIGCRLNKSPSHSDSINRQLFAKVLIDTLVFLLTKQNISFLAIDQQATSYSKQTCMLEVSIKWASVRYIRWLWLRIYAAELR